MARGAHAEVGYHGDRGFRTDDRSDVRETVAQDLRRVDCDVFVRLRVRERRRNALGVPGDHGELVLVAEEGIEVEYRLAERGQGDPCVRVQHEGLPYDVVRALGDGEYIKEEVGILDELDEARVVERRTLPWVAAADHVDKDDAESPYIAVRSVIWLIAREVSNTFCERKGQQRGFRMQGSTENVPGLM